MESGERGLGHSAPILAALGSFVTLLAGGPGYGVAVAGGYLLGSIPIALLVGRRSAGVDLRGVGDRNPGYWNAKETLGRRRAVPVFVGDALKGVAAGLVGNLCGGGWVTYAAVAAGMVGHAWPLFAGFRGGRSILTFAGGICVISPPAGGIAIAALLLVTATTRSFAWGARVGVFSVPIIQAVVDSPKRGAATFLLQSIIGLRFLQAALATRRHHQPEPRPDPTE